MGDLRSFGMGIVLAHHVSRVGHGNVASLGRRKGAKVRSSVVPEGKAFVCRLSSVLPSRSGGSVPCGVAELPLVAYD